MSILSTINPEGGWRTRGTEPLSRENLFAVFHNDIPAIRVANFATPDECAALSAAIGRARMEYYPNVDPPIGRIGITQYEMGAAGKSEYFRRATQAATLQRQIFTESFDVLGRLSSLLTDLGIRADVAREPEHGSYFAGVVRQINASARLHVDVSCHDAPGWCIAKAMAQAAWNLYIETPTSGGETVIYRREWRSEDEQHHDEAYGYRYDLVNQAERVSVGPTAGDLVLFNCRNYHEVLAAKSNRLTIGSFIGLMPDDSLVLWS